MIQPSELRIGNYFIDHNGNIQNVGQLQDNFYGVSINGVDPRIFKCEPILLTPEMLKSIKLSKTVSSERLAVSYCLIEDYDGNFMLRQMRQGYHLVKNNMVIRKRKIKYVHELQNIYFIITGQELPISL